MPGPFGDLDADRLHSWMFAVQFFLLAPYREVVLRFLRH
jgi:hypothetical protein